MQIKLQQVVFSLLTLFVTLPIAHAKPSVTVSTSNSSVQKGQLFELTCLIEAPEAIKDIFVATLVPYGFVAEAMPSPHVQAKSNPVAIYIPRLAKESSIGTSFRIRAPNILGMPFKTEKDGLTGTIGTEDLKRFHVNVSYLHDEDSDETRHYVSNHVDIRYTTVMWLYLFSGLIGVSIGHFIKVTAEERNELRDISTGKSILWKFWSFLTYVYIGRMGAFFTVMAIGFAVLLAMAKTSLPVNSWHQSIALGIGIAVFADGKLIEKVRPG